MCTCWEIFKIKQDSYHAHFRVSQSHNSRGEKINKENGGSELNRKNFISVAVVKQERRSVFPGKKIAK